MRNCPLCGGNVIYRGLNSLECDNNVNPQYAKSPLCPNYRAPLRGTSGPDTVPMPTSGIDWWFSLTIGTLVEWDPGYGPTILYTVVAVDRATSTVQLQADGIVASVDVKALNPSEWRLLF